MTTTLAAADPMQTVDGGSSPLGFVLGILAFVALVALLAALGNAVSFLRARTRGGMVRTMHPATRRNLAAAERRRAARARRNRRTVLDSEPAGPVRTRHGR